MDSTIVITLVDQRTDSAVKIQETLTKYGKYIHCRLGLHDVGREFVSNEGLIILDVRNRQKAEELENELNNLEGVQSKSVYMNYDPVTS